MNSRAQHVAAAFVWACLAELDAPKPGNVHALAGGHRMTIEDFIRSANAAAVPLSAAGSRVGARILGAVEATVKPVFDAVVALMEDLVARGELRADVDARHVCISAVAMAAWPFQEARFLEMVFPGMRVRGDRKSVV